MANVIENYMNKRRETSRYRRFGSHSDGCEISNDDIDNANLRHDISDEMNVTRGVNVNEKKFRRAVSSIEIDYECEDETIIDVHDQHRHSESVSESMSHIRNSGDALNNNNNDRHSLGSLNLLSQKYESLDYDQCENMLFLEEQRKFGYKMLRMNEVLRWVIFFFIGIFTAFTACMIVILTEVLSKYKYEILQKWTDKCNTDTNTDGCMMIPYGFWLLLNAVPIALGSALVTYLAPVAAGSGIPVIKCYLNGVKIPEVVRIKTYIAKAFGVVFSVVGGLACGKEGPMIHCGSIIAAGISQGKSTTFKKDSNLLQSFREDREKRDFVSAGAAAGVAAAFGAPVGGVLFSLEEGASFWNQMLTWRIFFCSMVSTFTLNLVLSAYKGVAGHLNYAGLLNFGKFSDTDFNYSFFELPLYVVMGIIGGLTGALFNYTNYKLTVFRIRYFQKRWVKVAEAVVVSMMTATVGLLMILYIKDCFVQNENTVEHPIQYNCPSGDYSVMGSLWFNTPEASLRNLFHGVKGTWSYTSLIIFIIFYFPLACWTYGLSVSSGLFIPSLLIGAAWGRLVGIGLDVIIPNQNWVYPGKFALIGAAASLGGVVRMTISLTVILIEATGNITFGLPIMITLMVAKWTGDMFTEGLYDIHIQLSSVPFLNWEPPVSSHTIYASEVMSAPVITFNATEKVSRIIDVLIKEPHNGFPIVDLNPDLTTEDCRRDSVDSSLFNAGGTYGRFRGLILRWQLIVMLQEKLFNESHDEKYWDMFNLQTFRNAYPRYPPIESVIPFITPEEQNYTIDLRPVMNPSAYSVSHSSSLPRIFRLFRALGLRHLIVVNDRNEVIGIVTRKDIARYRTHWTNGKPTLQELQISYS